MTLLLSLVLAANLSDLSVPAVSLAGTDGQTRDLKATVVKSRFTVFTFFSRKCPCVRAHDGVLRKLHSDFSAKGVQFFSVDSESGATVVTDKAEAEKHGYPMPILIDADATLAKAMEATFATTTVIVDAAGHVVYRGGIDSSKHEPDEKTKHWLRDALTALVDGNAPPVTEPKSLGCYLRLN